jgi:transcriptional regulator with XRE-family HTH domain
MQVLQQERVDRRNDRKSTASLRGKLIPHRQRERGVILTLQGWHKLQAALQQAADDRNFGLRFTREHLSELTGLSVGTISRILKRQEAVDLQSLEQFLQAFNTELTAGDCAPPVSPLKALASRQVNPRQDWGEAIDVSVFYGREAELAHLRQWIVAEHCRLVTVLGMGGIGKSTLAVKLGLLIQTEFDSVIWRSLQRAPSLEDYLESILPALLRSQNQNTDLSSSLSGKLSQLMTCLRSSRCLLIFDNVETLLSSGVGVGQWRTGYEEYGQLFRLLGEVPHQSCAILTSREKPSEIALLESDASPVRSFRLKGLMIAASQQLFHDKGTFIGTDAEWSRLIEHYGGNPLMLKFIAAATQDLFNSQIAEALKYVSQDGLIIEDIRALLAQQFDRLSDPERDVVMWLAHHQSRSFAELEQIPSPKARQNLPVAVNALLKRSLLEKDQDTFCLQSIVMKYVMSITD